MERFKKLKTFFVPRHDNDFKPHFFRERAVLGMALVIVLFFVTAFALQSLVIRGGFSQIGAVISSTLVELANNDRKANDLGVLTVNPVLEEAARLKAQDMVAKGYFAHESPEGVEPWHWFEEAGYDFSFAGENLAVYFTDSVELQNAWMNSPSHRANILNSYFTEIGIAVVPGVYQGRDTVFVVQEFGRPKRGATLATTEQQTQIVPDVKNSADPEEVVEEPVVLGEQVVATQEESVIVQETGAAPADMFIAVAQEDNGETTVIAASQDELTEGDAPEPVVAAVSEENVSLVGKVAASPGTTLRIVYMILAGVILFGLFIMIVVEIRKQHSWHIALGVSLLVLMGVLLYVWNGFFFGGVVVV
jgi:hypothetical protein